MDRSEDEALPPAAAAAFRAACRQLAARSFRHMTQAAQGALEELTEQELDLIIAVAGQPPHIGSQPPRPPDSSWWWNTTVMLDALAEVPGVRPKHLVRVSAWIRSNLVGARLWNLVEHTIPIWANKDDKADLREVVAAFAELGVSPSELMGTMVGLRWSDTLIELPDRVLAGFATEQAEELVARLVDRSDPSFRAEIAWRLLAAARELTEPVATSLFGVALLARKAERTQAWAAAEGVLSDLDERLRAALRSTSADERRSAAEWISRRTDPGHVPGLRAALAKERAEPVKAALLIALERLGVSLDDLLDREGLLAEARAGLAKKRTADFEELPLEDLPAVRWRERGERVAPEVVQWWVLRAATLKQLEPSPLLRRYLEQLVPQDVTALGRELLGRWLAEDLKLPTEVPAKVEAEWRQWAQWMKTDEEAAVAAQRARYLAEPHGSAIGWKGMLAVVAAAGGPEPAAQVGPYLKTWYGLRAAQCKALLAMLGHVEHRSAVQVVMATAVRFRTKGIREEAERIANELAARRGWTVDELGDRTIPDAGIEDDGRLRLDYRAPRVGEEDPPVLRSFWGQLGSDGELHLLDADGAPLRALPDPRAGEDPGSAKAAKSAWSASRKALKEVLTLQGQRLYEAMCAERTWSMDDWRTWLLGHPIMPLLVRRLVWQVVDNGQTFRPLADGTLSSADDDEVVLSGEAMVRLAHATTTDPATIAAWRTHLADHEVKSPFDQLGRVVFTVPEGEGDRTSDERVLGHLVETFSLRNGAKKRGWLRGEAEDGGWFHRYFKPFPGLGLEASIRFSGTPLPETSCTVALLGVEFARTAQSRSIAVPLGAVPRVLYSEVVNDAVELAATGPGYDPDWQARVAG
jgi:hypothetical protein